MRLGKIFDKLRSGAYEKLFDEEFMNRHTNSTTLREMFFKGGYTVNTIADIENIPQQELDQVIKKNTDFKTWEEMKKAAGKKYLNKD